jgi:hypothetical protein
LVAEKRRYGGISILKGISEYPIDKENISANGSEKAVI